MSINHFSPDFSQTLWWTQQHHLVMEQPSHPITNSQFPNNNKRLFIPYIHDRDGVLIDTESSDFLEREEEESVERESMFEKHLTPSDVGKLNRLVIPKQHAENYFPLNNNNNGGDSGMLLSFEDESGKGWRFRYSYWNSSQSYVLTKGWSRFVKEKQLDAGDVVLFERHRVELDRFFIGWRHRASLEQDSGPGGSGGGGGNSSVGGGGGWTRVFYSAHPYPSHPFPYQTDCLQAGSMGQNKTMPVANSKRLRLFGVNLECQQDDQSSEPPTPDGSSLSSQGQEYHLYYPESHNDMVRHNF